MRGEVCTGEKGHVCTGERGDVCTGEKGDVLRGEGRCAQGRGMGPGWEGSCVPQHVPKGYPRVSSVSVHWGEDVLLGVRVWAVAHEQPPACSEQSTAVSQ